MTDKQLERYRNILQQLAVQLRMDLAELTQDTLTGASGVGELSHAPLHLGDMGTDEYLHDLNATLLENEEYIAREIVDALRRLNEGGFGVCEECENPIAQQRLIAIPYTRYCIDCARKISGGSTANLNAGRPVGPGDTLLGSAESPGERPRPRRDNYADGEPENTSRGESGDPHAAGTPGGGAETGGLAGSNYGHGDPDLDELDRAAGGGTREKNPEPAGRMPRSGRGGGSGAGRPDRNRRP